MHYKCMLHGVLVFPARVQKDETLFALRNSASAVMKIKPVC